ncbi:hypothetical protein [Pelagicoccus sp. SDUM812005]|uniref:hypothetical protein n=1 Tax=Pelagicoccus sp. SDUM812005 TaxID=3041257 RepID=UPI00280EFEF1|nr:hypothetical protein [Pelagicoccus sp. SDUM812005]MDQ8183855.1 hypothetical protein [Pelagicoccus sp. SDUM812005]
MKTASSNNRVGSIDFVKQEITMLFDDKPSPASITVFTFCLALTACGFGHGAIGIYFVLMSTVSGFILRKEINKKEIIKGIIFVSFIVTILGLLRFVTGFSTWHGSIPRWQSVVLLGLGISLFSFAVFTHWILSKFEK